MKCGRLLPIVPAALVLPLPIHCCRFSASFGWCGSSLHAVVGYGYLFAFSLAWFFMLARGDAAAVVSNFGAVETLGEWVA